MAKSTVYLTYYIVKTDPDEVAALQAQYPQGVNRAITAAGGTAGAVAEFAAPFKGFADPQSGAPYIWTPWRRDASSDKPFPLDVATFSRHTGGFLGIGGTTIKYYWMGLFVLAAAASPTVAGVVPPSYANIPIRRWAEGFENPGTVIPAGFGASGLNTIRDAARRVGGMGLALRGASQYVTITLAAQIAGYTSSKSWERMYVRLRQKPTGGAVRFWRTDGFPSSVNGVQLAIDGTGAIVIMQSDVSAGVTTLQTVGLLPVWTGRFDDNAWRRLDLLIEYNAAAGSGTGRFRLFMNGVQLADILFAGGTSLGAFSGRHLSTALGGINQIANDLYLDIDDWVSAEIPNVGGVEALTSRDWLSGSSVVRLRPTGFTGNHANWTGDVRTLGQQGFGASNTTGQALLTSTTSGAVMEVSTDSDLQLDADKAAIGVACVEACLNATGGAATTGTLGIGIAGAAPVMTNITQDTSKRGHAALVSQPGNSPTFADMTPVVLRHVKGANVSSSSVGELDGQAELIGIFGPEDFRLTEADTPPTFPGTVGIHNAPYPRTPYAVPSIGAPIGPYIVVCGTYVGNGTGQDLTFRAPVHLFFARPVGVTNVGGQFWTSTTQSSKVAFGQGQAPALVDALEDPSFVQVAGDDAQQNRYIVRIAGAYSQLNANAVTYQYLAVCDPAGRFLLNGALSHRSAQGSTVNSLFNPAFTPDFLLLLVEDWSNTVSIRLYVKAAVDAATTRMLTAGGGAALSSAIALQAGALQTEAALHAVVSSHLQMPFSAWRKADGNNDPGQAAVLSVGMYTGNGAGNRSLQVGTAGKRPLFAWLFGVGVTSYFRDPGHLTTNSSSTSGGTESTGGFIGGDIDSFTVASASNTTGVDYYYFVLWGGTAAGNGGWAQNGEYIPVEAGTSNGPYTDPVDPSTIPPVVEPEPEPPADLATDLAAACAPYTHKVVNLALSFLGVTQQVLALGTEQSREAQTARLHYTADTDEVLRAFPWNFARRYAGPGQPRALTLVAGTTSTAAQPDWQYSYRPPADCLFVRRVVDVNQRRRVGNPPIPFDRGADDVGELVFCDQVDAVIEYTARVPCPASARDPIFVKALAFRLASSMAQPLGRDSQLADKMLRNFALELDKAELAQAREKQEQDSGTDDPDWVKGR